MQAPYKIAIVGQGVIGLTCALSLLKDGYRVDVFSREPFEETTSMAAGAYWWPHRAYPRKRISRWAKESYDQYKRTCLTPESGVHFEKHFRFCLDPDEGAYARHLVDEWHEIDGTDYGIPSKEAYLLKLPVMDVPTFMHYLRDMAAKNGASFFLRNFESPGELFPEYDLVVNCSGVWAYHFVKDKEVFPIRGQVVRVSRPEGLRESTRLYQKDGPLTLVLPRSEDVILGGTTEAGNWSREPSDEESSRIFERCSNLVPQVRGSRILGASVGLRPGRKHVRLELELIGTGCPVVHNYGHGGSGYTVAWGCANEVTALVTAYFSTK